MTVRLEIRDAVAWVTFDRPEARNAFTQEMYSSLADSCADLATDDAIRVVVFQG
ncbi:MAG: enoyl-CoA hydratase-related protein, partial [Candidatus Limnocylindria bacterium]